MHMIGQVGIIVHCRRGSVYAEARIHNKMVVFRSEPYQPPFRVGMRVRIVRRHITEWIAEQVPPSRRRA